MEHSLENAHACHPKAMEITSALVKAFFQEGKYHSIAYLFEVLSNEDVLYLKHTAEFYKVAGRESVADYFFSLGKKGDWYMAKSANFLKQENYAALLTIPFKPSTLLKNSDLSYAIAYSHFKYLELSASKSILDLSDKKNNQKNQLAVMIEKCRQLDWQCRP
jgi:hypothetical protein